MRQTSKSRARKLRVLFVAGLGPLANGDTGGQVAAASTLVESPLAALVDIIPLSTSMPSTTPVRLTGRLWAAARRLVTFCARLRSADVAVIFAADGIGAVEKGLMAILARRCGRGVVVRFSSGTLARHCERSRTMRWWVARVLASCHGIVGQGPFWTRFFESFPEGRGKVVQIVNAVHMIDRELLEGHRRTGKHIVYVGWIFRPKGVLDALDAFEKVLQRVPEATFTLIGGGQDMEEFRAAVARKEIGQRVECTGWLPKQAVFERLLASDVFFLPSHAEGLPNAMLEAMSAGLPVVATRVGSIPDVVVHGESGFLTDVGDTVTMAEALLALIEDPARARQMGDAGRHYVEQHHAIDVIWPRFASIIARAAREAGRAGKLEVPGVVEKR